MSGSLSRRDLIRGGTGLFGLAAVGALNGCGNERESSADDGGNGPVTLRYSWWGSDAINERMLEMVALAEAELDITIEGEYTPIDTYFQKLSTQVAAGNQPDMFEMNYPSFSQYAQNGALLSLDDYVGDLLDLSGYSAAAVDIGKVQGEQLGVPIGASASCCYFLPDRFEAGGVEPPTRPWTWEQFADAMQRISDATPDGFYGTGDHGGFDTFLELWVRQRGGLMFTEDGELGFSQEHFAAWLQYWEDLRASGAATPPDVTAEGGIGLNDAPMVRGSAALRFGGVSNFQAAVGLVDEPVDFTAYPVTDGENGQYPRPSAYLCGSSASEDPEATAEGLAFLLNNAEARGILGTLLGVPLSSDTADMVSESGSDVDRRTIEYQGTVTEGATAPPPPPTGAGEITNLAQRANEDVGFGRASVQQATETFFSEAERALSS